MSGEAEGTPADRDRETSAALVASSVGGGGALRSEGVFPSQLNADKSEETGKVEARGSAL